MMRRHTPNSNGGFTLAEMLIATALLSIVMSALYSLTYTTLLSWRSLESGNDAYREARNALAVFRREIDNMIPGGAPWFKGTTDEVTMYVVADPLNLEEAEGARLMEVRYYVERKGRVTSLMRDEQIKKGVLAESMDDDGALMAESRMRNDGKKQTFLLATNLRALEFRYVWYPGMNFGMQALQVQAVEPIIHDHHKENWGLPNGIEIAMTIEDPDNPEEGLTIVTGFPIRAGNAKLSRGAIINLAGASP